MSAYVSDKDVFIYLLQAAVDRTLISPNYPLRWYYDELWHQLDASRVHDAVHMAGVLLKENIKSVSHRYPDDRFKDLPGPKDPIQFKVVDFTTRYWKKFRPLQVIQTINALRYQSCEHPGWQESEAYAFLRALEETVIAAMTASANLEWGAPPRDFSITPSAVQAV